MSIVYIDQAQYDLGYKAGYEAAIKELKAKKPYGWLCKSGHGNHFREWVSTEHQELIWGNKRVWQPVYRLQDLE